jgi:hypothetical protein
MWKRGRTPERRCAADGRGDADVWGWAAESFSGVTWNRSAKVQTGEHLSTS